MHLLDQLIISQFRQHNVITIGFHHVTCLQLLRSNRVS
jgi:hypothetical protein